MAIASFKAGEGISAGDAVFVSSAGLVFKALADTKDNASVAGIAVNGGSVGDLIRVNLDAIYTSSSTYSPPQDLYLSLTTSGAYVDYESVASGLAVTTYPGVYLTKVGTAVTSNKINVEVSLPRFIINPTSVLLLETSAAITIDAILQEDGSTIKTEDAT
jgi:hypothetical protein